MAPSHSRQLLVWTLPTIAVLLSYLWYKKKRIGLQSDPGDTEKSEETLKKSTEEAAIVEVPTFSRSLSGVDSAPIDIVVPPRLRGIKSHPVNRQISDEELDIELAKINPNRNKSFEAWKPTTPKSTDKAPSPVHLTTFTPITIKSGSNHIVTSPDIMAQKVESNSSEEDVPQTPNVSLESETIEVHDSKGSPESLQRQHSDRDSANTSPIDVILASPSLSSISDNHSEISDVELDIELAKINPNRNKSIEVWKPATPKSTDKAPNPVHLTTFKPITIKSGRNHIVTSPDIMAQKAESNSSEEDVPQTPNVSLESETIKVHDSKCSPESLQRQHSDRDSANTSPIDVILASPSLSSISDNHSEVSNDSGKGCSDLVTPPPGPAPTAESPLPDEETVIIFEFKIASDLVGKLIGKQGRFVSNIKDKTDAHIVIKRDPSNRRSEFKICEIEGTERQIEEALGIIRDRFPLKNHPDLTLERINFPPPPPVVTLMPDALFLKFIEGINNDTMLSCMVAPNHLFLQQPLHPSFQHLCSLVAAIQNCYMNHDTPLLPTPIPEYTICIAHSVDLWLRAMVLSTDDETSYVKFVDYGGYAYVSNDNLRQIKPEFVTLAFQATECFLAGVKPIGESGWSTKAYDLVADLAKGAHLFTQVVSYSEHDIPLVYVFACRPQQNIVFLNEELIKRGLAEHVYYPGCCIEGAPKSADETPQQEQSPKVDDAELLGEASGISQMP